MLAADNSSPRAFWRRGLSGFSDLAAASHARAAAVLVAFCLLAFLPGALRIPPIDRDEARFAQATKQMVETGDYVDIRYQDEVRYKKPVGIYWLQAAVVQTADALGVDDAAHRIALYRVPSLLGATGGVLLTYWTALAFISRRAAFLAATMLAASILLGIEARLAKTDAVLFMTVIAAMGAMARLYLGAATSAVQQRWVLPAILWTAIAGGVLVKGPLILMIVGVTALALAVWDRSWRWLLALRPVLGLVWVTLLATPWFAAIVMRSGDAFLSQSVGGDLLSKITSGQESHGAPPGYYLLLFFATFWPASIFSGLAAPAIWHDRHQAPTRFLLAWLVPCWIIFELVMTKLPHYVLPLYPAIAILIAGRILPPDLSRNVWLQRGTLWWFVVPLVIGIGGIVGLAVIGGKLGGLAGLLAGAAIIFGFRAWWLYDADGPERALLRACVASVLLGAAVYARLVPFVPNLFPSAALAQAVHAARCEHPVAAAAGYHEPSLVFLVGTSTLLTDGAGAADFLLQGGCRFALVETRHQRAFAQRAEAIGLRYRPAGRVEGVNISGGKAIAIAIFQTGE